MKIEDELEETIKSIFQHRKLSRTKQISAAERLVRKNMKFRNEANDKDYTTKLHWKYLSDQSTTFMKHLHHYFEPELIYERRGKEKRIQIKDEKTDALQNLVKSFDTNFPLSDLGKYKDAKWFVENYGLRYDRKKASRKTSKPKTTETLDSKLVLSWYEKILQNKAKITFKELISEISSQSGKNEKNIIEILNSNEIYDEPIKDDSFSKRYLEISGNGKLHAEFEAKTREIFKTFGFPIDKLTHTLPSTNRLEIDGFVQDKPFSGIIDAKSGKKFSCNNKEVGIMGQYIENFKKYHHNGIDFELIFFAYVYGKKFENLTNFCRIIKDTEICGSIISAIELVKLKKKFELDKISKDKIWKLFQKNGEITSLDY